jgi:phospholipid transport system substrate-binding protein
MKNGWTNSALMVLLMLALGATTQAEPEPSPRELIMRATERLVDALQENRQAIRKNRAIAREIADEVAMPLIDFPGIARGVLGSHWRAASQEQRARFTQAFRRFLESVYVTAMAIYADEIISHAKNISYPPLQMRDGSREAVVRTLIRLRGGLKVEVNYIMHRVGGYWKVHDVSVLGISLAKIYRTTFAREIRRRGLDGLIAELETRTGTGTPDLLGVQ